MNATKQVRCGNHGRNKVYHNSVADVRDCYAGRFEDDGAAAAEQAYERHLENQGWEEARAQDDWEQRNGVIDFQTAWAMSEQTGDDSGMWPWAGGQRPGQANQEPATELRENDWNKWSSADRERAQFARGQACSGLPPAKRSPVTQDGMYRDPKSGEIFKVQWNRGSGDGRRLYAKRMLMWVNGEKHFAPTKATAELWSKERDSVEFEYAPGAMRVIQAEWRMTLAEALEFGALYGTCVRCGRTLTKEESIARAMGDTCASKGNWA